MGSLHPVVNLLKGQIRRCRLGLAYTLINQRAFTADLDKASTLQSWDSANLRAHQCHDSLHLCSIPFACCLHHTPGAGTWQPVYPVR
jgi:hypothetical protein